MRKKRHKRLHSSNADYRRFYIASYLVCAWFRLLTANSTGNFKQQWWMLSSQSESLYDLYFARMISIRTEIRKSQQQQIMKIPVTMMMLRRMILTSTVSVKCKLINVCFTVLVPKLSSVSFFFVCSLLKRRLCLQPMSLVTGKGRLRCVDRLKLRI